MSFRLGKYNFSFSFTKFCGMDTFPDNSINSAQFHENTNMEEV